MEIFLGVLIGFALSWLSIGAGYVVHARINKSAVPALPKPICMCEHHYGEHEPKTGVCNVTTVRISPVDIGRSFRCACLRYTGPEPLSQYIPTELSA